MSEQTKALSLEDLTPGAWYRVAFDDCCVKGEITDRLARLEFTEEAGEQYLERAVFERASFDGSASVSIEETRPR